MLISLALAGRAVATCIFSCLLLCFVQSSSMDFTSIILPTGHETLTLAERKMNVDFLVHKYSFSTGGSQLGGQFPLCRFTGLVHTVYLVIKCWKWNLQETIQ